MAGAGYKLFQTGDVLTAAQVNTYLNEQTVMVFASAAARTSALSGVLAEGMVSYLQDTNAVEVYDGSAWVSIGASGDITAVNAGTGLSGGGTSGSVTLSLSTPISATNGGTAQTTYASGDLLYASATDTLAKRAIGTTGQVLTVSGGLPTWATPSSGGGTWATYTPTYYNLTIGNGTVVAKYTQTGNLATVFWSLTYGSTTSISGGTPAVSLPANCPSAWNEVVTVAGKLEDVGTAFWLGGAMIVQPDRFRLQYFGTSGTNLTSDNVSSTAPMTWTTNDVIKVTFTYEVA